MSVEDSSTASFSNNPMDEIFQIFIAATESSLNTYIKLDPDYKQKLTPLYDKVIAINFIGVKPAFATLYLFFDQTGIQLTLHYSGEADTIISGTPLSLIKMGLRTQDVEALFSGDITLKGDVALGQRFKRVLDNLDIDWEEWLSKILGDFAAHKIGNIVRDSRHWSKQATNSLSQNIKDYLQLESNQLPSNEDVTQFLSDVDQLRDDTERLDARIKILQENFQ